MSDKVKIQAGIPSLYLKEHQYLLVLKRKTKITNKKKTNTENFSLPAAMSTSRISLYSIFLISTVKIKWEELLTPCLTKELLLWLHINIPPFLPWKLYPRRRHAYVTANSSSYQQFGKHSPPTGILEGNERLIGDFNLAHVTVHKPVAMGKSCDTVKNYLFLKLGSKIT